MLEDEYTGKCQNYVPKLASSFWIIIFYVDIYQESFSCSSTMIWTVELSPPRPIGAARSRCESSPVDPGTDES